VAVEIDRSDSVHPCVVAHYVASADHAGEHAMRQSARVALPAHEVPARFVAHRALPLTAEGKIDRRAPPQRARPRPATRGGGQLTGRYEQQIADVWHELLRVPVHAQSDFFALGGDSLLALRAVLELEARLNCPVSLNVLFRARTPRELASQLAQHDTVPDFRY